MLLRADSGHLYTRSYLLPSGSAGFYDFAVYLLVDLRSTELLEPVNVSTTSWHYDADLQIDKHFEVWNGLVIKVYFRCPDSYCLLHFNMYPLQGLKNMKISLDYRCHAPPGHSLIP